MRNLEFGRTVKQKKENKTMTKGQAMRKRTKIFIKLISFMLALVTLFCILPLTAFADEPRIIF